MIDYKNYKVIKTNKKKLLYWVIFTIITALLWITAIEMLFK